MNHFIGHAMVAFLQWLAVVTGTHIPAGQYSSWYNFWSGFGSDLTEFGIVVGLAHLWLNGRCHEGGPGIKGCRKHGHYEFHDNINNVTYKLCKRHHPGVPEKPHHLHFAKIHKQQKEQVYEH